MNAKPPRPGMTSGQKTGIVLLVLGLLIAIGGLVGTIYGVGCGISGFADFMKGEVTSEQIKQQVGMITEGLHTALLYTITGLTLGTIIGAAGAIVLAVASSRPRTQEGALK